ncbi:MAG: DarT ssDNA thymidine ADP-ribosyltransferase family protein [Polaromonas sp.]|nr:DarT ssDNA thymidine ADP-ribosyltransferase family protein [Polaromonas sp.]
MKTIIQKYKFDGIWHFTDKSNIESIKNNNGLISFGELQRNNIAIPAPGGNEWSHEADIHKGVHEYVHLAFLDDHPMLYAAKQDGRIKNPIWLKIDSSVLLDTNVRFTNEVSNKAGVQLLTPDEAREQIDFEVLFTYMDWKNPEIQARRRLALKSEILIPRHIPLNKILGKKNG